MAKRARGSTSRPGQRAPLRAAAARPSGVVTRPATLTDEEEARAAELEAQIVAAEKAAETAQRRARTRRDSGEPASVLSGSIAVRAAEEYRYVARDMRRILVIGGGLTLFLVGLWVVTEITGIGIV
jgi:hypothetical protein